MKIPLPLDDSQRVLVRTTSKALLGSNYALEAAVSMAQGEVFFQGAVAKDAGCEPSYLSEFTKRLLSIGLIELVDTEPGQARKYYRRRPSPLWQFALDLVEQLLSGEGSGVTRLSDRRGTAE
jgi:hypothetical protein